MGEHSAARDDELRTRNDEPDPGGDPARDAAPTRLEERLATLEDAGRTVDAMALAREALRKDTVRRVSLADGELRVVTGRFRGVHPLRVDRGERTVDPHGEYSTRAEPPAFTFQTRTIHDEARDYATRVLSGGPDRTDDARGPGETDDAPATGTAVLPAEDGGTPVQADGGTLDGGPGAEADGSPDPPGVGPVLARLRSWLRDRRR